MEALQDVEGENYEGIYVLEEQIADLKLQRQYFEDTYKNRREKQSINILKISNEIEDLREEYEDNVGEPLRINGDLKNWFAWFAFEETAYRMANDVGLEL
jgi:hypothetical protein